MADPNPFEASVVDPVVLPPSAGEGASGPASLLFRELVGARSDPVDLVD